MGKDKLRRFAEMATFENVRQPKLEEVLNKDYELKGNWHREIFRNDRPIVLELGCGKGEYTVGLARRYPEKNFIGVDIKGARMWRGASDARQENLTNAFFLRTRIEQITSFFGPAEVSEIWITFPDPQEKRIRARKRLTSSRFLPKYKQFLAPGGIVHLKTDNHLLYEYSCRLCAYNHLEIIKSTANLHQTETNEDLLSIKTHYESIFASQGISIKYLSFKLNGTEHFEEPPEEA